MPTYRSKPHTVEAVQWRKLGDSPTVRLLNAGDSLCRECNAPYRDHGVAGGRSLLVCPGNFVLIENGKPVIMTEAQFFAKYEEV